MDVESDGWQKVFLTRIVGPDYLPDVTIITLASTTDSSKGLGLNELNGYLFNGAGPEGLTLMPICGSSLLWGESGCRAALNQAIIDGAVREEMPWMPPEWDNYAKHIFDEYEFPI